MPIIKCLLAAILLGTVPYAFAAELVVHVDHIGDDHGNICVAVHRAESSYLDNDDAKAFRLNKVPAATPSVTLSFSDLPAGKYAIKVFHDKNGDGVLNRNLFGAPTEPYGISNNVRARFSLPPFGEALIEVLNPRSETHINLAGHTS